MSDGTLSGNLTSIVNISRCRLASVPYLTFAGLTATACFRAEVSVVLADGFLLQCLGAFHL